MGRPALSGRALLEAAEDAIEAAGLGGARFKATRGMLIAVEGPRYAGKTTLSHVLVAALRKLGINSYTVEHPKETSHIGVEALSLHQVYAPEPLTATLFIADMIDTVVGGVDESLELERHLEEGYFPIYDRYFYSTMVYQGYLAGEAYLRVVKQLAALLPPPHLVIYLDCDCRVAAERRVVQEHGKLDEHLVDDYIRECEYERAGYNIVLSSQEYLVPGEAWREFIDDSLFAEPRVVRVAGNTVAAAARALKAIVDRAVELGLLESV